MNSDDKFIGVIFSVVWIALSLITGCVSSMINPNDICAAPMHRIEYASPWFRLGCWLGGVPK